MPTSAKNIKIRIRSVKNINKITKAMELISATKMRKDSRLVESSRPYDLSASEVMEVILKAQGVKGKFFLKVPAPKKIAVLIFSSNRGLCGSFNSQLVTSTKKSLALGYSDTLVDWITVGKKGTKILSRLNEKIVAEFKKPESGEEAEEFLPLSKFLTQKFLANEYDEIKLAFVDFLSPVKQYSKLQTILPFHGGAVADEHQTGEQKDSIIFEPNTDQVLAYLAPRYLEEKLYQSLLKSNASEHSARMAAMKNATDASSDLIDDLVFSSNEIRQATITREIAEIAGGKAAVED